MPKNHLRKSFPTASSRNPLPARRSRTPDRRPTMTTCSAPLTRTARYAVAPGALPLLGHALPLARRPQQFLTALPRYGDLVEVRLGRRPAVMVCDPELIQRVLLEPRTFDK